MAAKQHLLLNQLQNEGTYPIMLFGILGHLIRQHMLSTYKRMKNVQQNHQFLSIHPQATQPLHSLLQVCVWVIFKHKQESTLTVKIKPTFYT